MSASKQSIVSAPDNAQSTTSIIRPRKYATAVFITQKKEPLNIEEVIAENFDMLNKYIDSLDPKIKKIIEHNEAEVLIAYRNHFGRVREEIVRFKEETLAQVKSQANVILKMEKMEKQLILFRAQALRLFELASQKDKTIQLLELQLTQLVSERNHLKEKVKELMKTQKRLKVKEYNQDSLSKPSNSTDKELKTEQFERTFHNLGFQSYKKSLVRDKKIKERTFTVSNCQHSKALQYSDQIEQFTKNAIPIQKANFFEKKENIIQQTLKDKFGHIDEDLLEEIIQQTQNIFQKIQKKQKEKEPVFSRSQLISDMRKTKYSLHSKPSSYHKLSVDKKRSLSRSTINRDTIKTTTSVADSELRTFFERCVQTVKKQIAMRKNRISPNLINNGHSISIDDFKKVDFFKLLELTFENKRLKAILEDNLVGPKNDPLKF